MYNIMSEIQAILFEKKYWNTLDADLWLKKYNLKKIKPFHITKNYIRARIRNPNKYKYFRLKKIKDNIKLDIGFK